MSDFFEQKINSQKQFRQRINKLLIKSPLIQTTNQLDISTLTSILSQDRLQLMQKDRINLQKLYEILKQQEYSTTLSYSDFKSIFGPMKTIKISQLSSMLCELGLNSFDLKSEIKHLCFEDKKFKFAKYDKMMKNLGYNILNTKNKEIITDCYDFNGNKCIDEQDLDYLMEMIEKSKGMGMVAATTKK